MATSCTQIFPQIISYQGRSLPRNRPVPSVCASPLCHRKPLRILYWIWTLPSHRNVNCLQTLQCQSTQWRRHVLDLSIVWITIKSNEIWYWSERRGDKWLMYTHIHTQPIAWPPQSAQPHPSSWQWSTPPSDSLDAHFCTADSTHAPWEGHKKHTKRV